MLVHVCMVVCVDYSLGLFSSPNVHVHGHIFVTPPSPPIPSHPIPSPHFSSLPSHPLLISPFPACPLFFCDAQNKIQNTNHKAQSTKHKAQNTHQNNSVVNGHITSLSVACLFAGVRKGCSCTIKLLCPSTQLNAKMQVLLTVKVVFLFIVLLFNKPALRFLQWNKKKVLIGCEI